MSLKKILNFEQDPLYVMDGNAFIYQGYYANSKMTRSDSFPSGAIYIVGRTLLKIMREENPQYFAFILDGRGPHFRHAIYPDYKANRSPAPEELIQQIEPIKRMVQALGIHLEVSEGCEADDYIASLASQYKSERPVVMIARDKDLKQCLDLNVVMWDPGSREGKLTTQESFTEETGLSPNQWADVQALIGDASDNIPGVRGIGEKTAMKLFQDFPNLEAIQDKFDLVPPTIKKKLEGNLAAAFMYRKLTTLAIDKCMDLKLHNFNIDSINPQELFSFFREFEMYSLERDFAQLLQRQGKNQGQQDISVAPVAQPEEKTSKPIFVTSVMDLPSCKGKALAYIPTEHGIHLAIGSIPLALAKSALQTSSTNSITSTGFAPSTSTPSAISTNPTTFDNHTNANTHTASPVSTDSAISTTSAKPTPQAIQKPATKKTKERNVQQSLFSLLEKPLTTSVSNPMENLPPKAEEITEKTRAVEIIKAELAENITPEHIAPEHIINMNPNPENLNSKNITKKELAPDYIYTGDTAELLQYLQNAGRIILCDLKLFLHNLTNTTLSNLSLSAPTLSGSSPWISFDRFFDLSIAAWLLSPEDRDYGWPRISARRALQNNLRTDQPAQLALLICDQMISQLEECKMLSLMLEMEMPLAPVLVQMELKGIRVNTGALFSFLEEVQAELNQLTEKIYMHAGGSFNIRSAQQIGEVLFKQLKLPVSKSTKGGQASTSSEELEKLSDQHPIVNDLQEFRKLEKLRSTYLEPLPKFTGQDNRIHTTLNQCATATGRLSSSNPNLQNIPIRGKYGQRMRSCFVAKPGHLLVSADYSQVELRILAHCSGDATLKQAFLNNEDIHSRTAALLSDVSIEQVTAEQRRNAKSINFGLLYGMGSRKLSQETGVSIPEAKLFIERYFERFQSIKSFYDEVEDFARKHSYVTTLAGRQRPLPDILSQSQKDRALAERQAVNTLIQGTAADVIKLAMLAVEADSILKQYNAELILQVHDELILEVPEQHAQDAAKRVAELMMDVRFDNKNLSVPLLVDYGVAADWGLAH